MIKILEIFKILIVPFLHIQFLRTFLLNKTLQNCHIHANYNNWNEKTDFLEIFFAFISVRLEHLLNLIIYKRFWIRAKSLAAKPSFSWSKPYIIVFKDSKSQRLTKGFFRCCKRFRNGFLCGVLLGSKNYTLQIWISFYCSIYVFKFLNDLNPLNE